MAGGFNDTGPRYNAPAATQAYDAMLAWFGKHLAWSGPVAGMASCLRRALHCSRPSTPGRPAWLR